MKIIITVETEAEACAIEEILVDAEGETLDFAFNVERQFDSACEIAAKERDA